jgi:hypothetical protein
LLAAIMTSDPPSLSETQPLSPWILDRTIRKCLKKHPDERWQSAHDLMDELKWIAEGGADASFRIVSRRTRRWPALVAGAGLVAAALIALLPARETRAPMVQASILPPEGMSFTSSFCTYCGRTNALIGLIVLPILTVVGLITYPLFLRARRYYYGY